MPKPPEIAPAPEAEVRRLIAGLRDAADEEAAERAAGELEALGLGALAPARAALADLPRRSPGRRGLESAVGRMAAIVREVVIEEGIPPSPSLTKLLRSMEGKPLSSDAMVGVILNFTRKQPKGAETLRLSVNRPGDDTGAVVRVRLTGEKAHPDQILKGWDSYVRVALGGETLQLGSGTSSLDHERSPEAYEDFAAAIDKALAGPSDQELTVNVHLMREY